MNFEDRISAYPGRYKMTDENGNTSYVMLSRADDPVVEGTPLNASSFAQMQDELVTQFTEADRKAAVEFNEKIKNVNKAVGMNSVSFAMNGTSLGFQITGSNYNPDHAIPLTLFVVSTGGYIGTIQLVMATKDGRPYALYYVCDDTIPVESITYSYSSGDPGCVYKIEFAKSLLGSITFMWPSVMSYFDGNTGTIDMAVALHDYVVTDQTLTRYVSGVSL